MSVTEQLHGTRGTHEAAAALTVSKPSGLSPHLLPLVEGEWAIWKLAGLRGTGFPATEVLKLATSKWAATVDNYLDAERESRAAKMAAHLQLDTALDALSSAGLWEDKDRRMPLVKALKQVKGGRPAEVCGGTIPVTVALSNFSSSLSRRDSLSLSVQSEFKAAALEMSRAIYAAASSPRFTEAVIWQNRGAWRRAIKHQLREPNGASNRSHKRRQHEELVAIYLQRYCMKNDTIGFFGPVGWARFVPEGAALEVRPGPGLLASRTVDFEGWCIDALGESLARDQSLRPWLAPRRLPFVGLASGAMILPGGAMINLTAKEAAVLAACDGLRKAKEIAAGLMSDRALGVKSEAEVYQCLDTFCKRGVIAWTLEVPLQRRADQRLRSLLEAIGDERLRRAGLSALDEMEDARERVAAAAGEPERLDLELQELEERFIRLTGKAATRGAGQTYGARTLVYEDCRRDIEVEVGPAVLGALAAPLSLLLQSARWLTYELARIYRDAFRSVYAELAARTKSPVVSAADFWIKCQPLFYKDETRLADRIVPLYQQRWAEVLGLQPGARRVKFSYEQLRPRVAAAFAAPRPGWTHARQHCPDVMIAAESPEAIRRGEFHLVIGEIHLAVNSLNSSLFLGQHPRPQEIRDAITADFPTPRLVSVPPKNWPTLTARTSFEFVSPRNYRLLVSPDACGVSPSQAVAISDLVVEEQGPDLVLRTRDERLRFEIVEGLGEFLSNLMVNFFHPLPPLRHTPRITIDRLTVSRESWRFHPSELAFAFQEQEVERFVAARRWRREFDLPRFLFAKSPVERKPFYVDLDSPILINLFARIIRHTKECDQPDPVITVMEMYPAHDELWLPDAEGNRYTSELRMVALDLSD